MTTIKEHDVVRLDTGETGVVVHVYPDGKTFEVETNDEVITVSESKLTKI